jgi:hypothetical protein
VDKFDTAREETEGKIVTIIFLVLLGIGAVMGIAALIYHGYQNRVQRSLNQACADFLENVKSFDDESDDLFPDQKLGRGVLIVRFPDGQPAPPPSVDPYYMEHLSESAWASDSSSVKTLVTIREHKQSMACVVAVFDVQTKRLAAKRQFDAATTEYQEQGIRVRTGSYVTYYDEPMGEIVEFLRLNGVPFK